MRRHTLRIATTVALAIVAMHGCDRDDGQPDPPDQTLVPCDPQAAADDPTACPPDAAPPDAVQFRSP
jgi:hypothetical protein